MALTYKELKNLYDVPKTNKYHNSQFTADGYTWDSMKEYSRWCELKLMERVRAINGLKRQVKFVLIDKSGWGREVSYIADFVYYRANKLIVEDVKSKITKDLPLFKLKKRLFAERYGFEITIEE